MKLKKESKETFQGIGPGKAISHKTPKAQQVGINMNRYVFPSQRTLWSKWNSQMSKKNPWLSVNYTADNN